MRRVWTQTALLTTFIAGMSVVLHGQRQVEQKAISFEVASVRANTSGDGSRRGIGMPPGGRLVMTDLPLRAIIRFAYDIQNVQLVGGPAWIDTDFFDIEAKAPSEHATIAAL